MNALALRGLILWVVARAVVAAGSAASAAPGSGSVFSTVLVGSTVTAIVVGMSWFEMRRRGELLFLANLGFAFRHAALFLVLMCTSMEACLALASA